MGKNQVNDKYKYWHRASGISWRLFGTLTLFVVLSLMVIWIFQIFLLNDFYEKSVYGGFNITESEIEEFVGQDEKIRDIVYRRSLEAGMCIEVYEISNGEVDEIAGSDVNVGCLLHHISREGLSQLYTQALDNGGVYTKKIVNPDDDVSVLNTIYVSIIESESGKIYVVMMDAELEPLNATVKTLQMQFGWIMCILIMGALIVALAISRIICAPLENMSKAARRLAKGDYTTEFAKGGYREAEELAEALNYASSELAKTDNLQKELVANISHDLRTPLTLIKGYSEVMRDIPGENNPENVQIIIDETERLTLLVNDVLDLSKLHSGTRKPELEQINLTQTIREVMTRYSKLTEKDNYVIAFDCDEDVFVVADKTMILQVIYNLINNALNYTGDDKKISVVQSVWNNRVRISVIDTGEGIPEEDIPNIWDRYYKVDKVHKRAKIGTGLGLSIVKGILDTHNALYGVESSIGEGSNFWFEMETFRDVDE